MADVVVIAGTVDARRIIEKLTLMGVKVAATVVSKFGSELLSEYTGIEVYEGRIDSGGMVSLLGNTGAACVVDASHPFASEASVNAMRSCELAGIPYIRFERCSTDTEEFPAIKVKNFEEAAERLLHMEGNIFLATGSNNLEKFTSKLPDYRKRLFARVLPTGQVLKKCEEAGLTAENIIAVKGPFSEEMNIQMFKYCDARILVTKESGYAGGTQEKLNAARRLGLQIVLIERPDISYGLKTDSIEEAVAFALNSLCKGGKD